MENPADVNEIYQQIGGNFFLSPYPRRLPFPKRSTPVGSSAEANKIALQRKTIAQALEWVAQSGVAFEAENTSLINFTRN